jgi:DNA-binding NarL/FixJ family response regulator
MAHLHLGAADQARHELLRAMELGLPNGFVTPFAETLPKFGGLTEILLRKHWPQHLDQVISLSQTCIPNWLTLKNSLPDAKLFASLSPTELEIAYCAARGDTARLISKRFGLSEGSINNKLQVIYDKLAITTSPPRKALVELML